MVDRFEGEIVGYILNEARMPFFMSSAYPHYKIENGKLVADNGPESKALREQATAAYDLMRRIQDRTKRGIRIPRTWVRQLESNTTLVLALRECRVITQEWNDQFHRAVRYLNAQTA